LVPTQEIMIFLREKHSWFGEMSYHNNPCLSEILERVGVSKDKLEIGD
jgi:hypothetical protein